MIRSLRASIPLKTVLRGVHRILCGGGYDSHILLPTIAGGP